MKFKVKEKPRYDDDEDEEEDDEDMPKARRSRREEVKPVKLKRRTREAKEDDDDDEEDDERAPVRSGWKGVDKNKEENSNYADDLKLSEDGHPKPPQVIRFLADEPYETFRQHWVTREGKRSFVCFGTAEQNGTGKNCPLCALDNSARSMASFRVVLLDEDVDPVIKTLTAGPKLTDQIKSYHLNPKSGPIDKMYYALSISGKKASTSYPMLPIKMRDLEEDYDITPLTIEELKALRTRAKTLQGTYRPTYKELLKVAKGSVGEDDDDD